MAGYEKQEREVLAKKIRAARQDAGLTQKQLADLVDLSEQQVRRIENAESQVSAVTFGRIAKACKLSLSRLSSMFDQINTVEFRVNRLWSRHGVKIGVHKRESKNLDYHTKRKILESLGFWDED